MKNRRVTPKLACLFLCPLKNKGMGDENFCILVSSYFNLLFVHSGKQRVSYFQTLELHDVVRLLFEGPV